MKQASTGSQKVAIPGYIGRSLTSFLIFIMGATMRGETEKASNWFLTKLGRFRNEKFLEFFFLLAKRSTIRSHFE
jgi:hypothetical protein